MSKISFETNDTVMEEDFFVGVYNDKVAVWSLVIVYIIGLVGMIGIVLIIWFERSGEAGPFRTLINQLVTHNYEAVSYFHYSNYQTTEIFFKKL